MDDYKEKLIAFCEGLEMRNIDELIEHSSEDFKVIGKHMVNLTKESVNILKQIQGIM